MGLQSPNTFVDKRLTPAERAREKENAWAYNSVELLLHYANLGVRSPSAATSKDLEKNPKEYKNAFLKIMGSTPDDYVQEIERLIKNESTPEEICEKKKIKDVKWLSEFYEKIKDKMYNKLK